MQRFLLLSRTYNMNTSNAVPRGTDDIYITPDSHTTSWIPGDIVIHEDDAKRQDMLMVVVGQIKRGPNAKLYRTRYLNTDASDHRAAMHEYRRTVWKNPISKLHDPARFGISLPPDGKAAAT